MSFINIFDFDITFDFLKKKCLTIPKINLEIDFNPVFYKEFLKLTFIL